MSDKKTAPLLLNVDASEVLTQTGELLKLLELPASSFQGIPEHVVDLFFDRGLTTSSLVISRPQSAQLTPVKFVSKSKSSGWLNISLPQSGHTVRMVCMNISFLLLGRLKSKRFLAVGE